MKPFGVTVETDGRIELPQARTGTWVPPAETAAVVTIRGPGELEVTALSAWSRARGVSEGNAKRQIEKAMESVRPPGVPRTHLAPLSQTRRRGSQTCTVKLPQGAVWYLFPDGTGPAAPKRARSSASVLVRPWAGSLFIWYRRAEGYLEDGGIP